MAAELIFNCLLGLGLLFFLAQAFLLPATDNPADVLGAAGFPIALGVLGLVVLAVITFRLLKDKTKVKILLFDLTSLDGRALTLNVALLLVYVLVVDILGFVLSTLLYLSMAGWLIGYRKPLRLALYAVAATATLTVVFGIVFAVPLPRGVGELRELTYLIY
jgi:hypothetical protein